MNVGALFFRCRRWVEWVLFFHGPAIMAISLDLGPTEVVHPSKLTGFYQKNDYAISRTTSLTNDSEKLGKMSQEGGLLQGKTLSH